MDGAAERQRILSFGFTRLVWVRSRVVSLACKCLRRKISCLIRLCCRGDEDVEDVFFLDEGANVMAAVSDR
jgi:hypothetical protein